MCAVCVCVSGPFCPTYYPFSPFHFRYPISLPRGSVCVRDIQLCADPRSHRWYSLDLDYFSSINTYYPRPIHSIQDVIRGSTDSELTPKEKELKASRWKVGLMSPSVLVGGVCVSNARIVMMNVLKCSVNPSASDCLADVPVSHVLTVDV